MHHASRRQTFKSVRRATAPSRRPGTLVESRLHSTEFGKIRAAQCQKREPRRFLTDRLRPRGWKPRLDTHA